MLKLNEIILKYPEDDAITLRSVFCTGIMERWILSLSRYIMNSWSHTTGFLVLKRMAK